VLLPPVYVRRSAGCGTEGEECTLELEPTAGETGTATVVVEAENGSGQVGVGTMVLTVETEAQAQALSTLGATGGGGGSLGFVGPMGLGLAALVVGGDGGGCGGGSEIGKGGREAPFLSGMVGGVWRSPMGVR